MSDRNPELTSSRIHLGSGWVVPADYGIFEALEALWMLHGFDTDTRILRQTHGGTRRQGAYSV